MAGWPGIRKVLRISARGLMIVVALLGAAIVSSLTVDLGPSVRRAAERAASSQLKRPVTIGRLAIHIFRGRFVVEDFAIAGIHPGDRPFFQAKHLSLGMDWSTALAARPEFTITSVELVDWHMLVEKWDGENNFPKLPSTRRDDEEDAPGPKRFTTTLKSLHAFRGRFTYEDHEAPWSVDAPNIDLRITNLPTYNGEASLSGGRIVIKSFEPMWANMRARFTIDKGIVQLSRIDLETDGGQTQAEGQVDFGHWPEQTYSVTSRLQFGRMRELFFAGESWTLSGAGDFKGVFHLYKGGHDLAGTFSSPLAGLNTYRFPQLYGALHWTPKLFEVHSAGSQFFGGDARYQFSIVPGPQGQPSRGTFLADYAKVDLAQLSAFQELQGLRVAGRASGHNRLEWPLGHFGERQGDGVLSVMPPAGAVLAADSLDAVRASDRGHDGHPWGPFAPQPLNAPRPIGAQFAYRYDGSEIAIDPSVFATEQTWVRFQGTTAWGGASRFTFHVVSQDWQESDEILAGIITDFGSRTGPVPFGGRGEFDGVMTGLLRRPRVEGRFSGEDLRAWDTLWGDGVAHIVVEQQYVTVTDGRIRKGDAELRAEGRFSLGYPRSDGGEELDGRFRPTRWDLESLRHAFQLDDYRVTGKLTGEFHLTGEYRRPIGFGAMTITAGTAYGEPFDEAKSSLRFEGEGIRLDGATIAMNGGLISGAAFVGWDGTYAFNAAGRRLPVERLAAVSVLPVRPFGLIDFTADGSATFAEPRYNVRFRVNDLFVGDEGVGQVSGTLIVRNNELTGEVEVASPRLALTGTGRIGMNRDGTSELSFRFHDSSLDPYVRLFVPKLSPFTTAVASGSIRAVGRLSDVDQLVVDATVDRVDMRLFDYAIANAAPIRLVLDRHVVRVEDLQMVGEDTRLKVGGVISLHDQRIALQATGDANLGILQGFFRDVRGSGRADLRAAIDGPLYEPVFSGTATITNGRIRHFSLPNALDGINGVIRFDPRSIRMDDVTAVMGGGRIQFGGRVGLDGYLPGDLDISARGQDMRLRYPEGVRSIVDADLTVRGNVKAPTLSGRVMVKSATWNRRIDPGSGIFDIGGGGASGASGAAGPAGPGGPADGPTVLPVRLDIEVRVPSTLRIENNLARVLASADLQLRGTYAKPLLFGRAEVDRGEVLFEGRRYLVTKGTIDFTNPNKIEPFFDVEAETRVRVPGQTYRVTVRAAGTTERLQPSLESDPPLPAAEVLALLFGDVRRNQQGLTDVELNALKQPNERQGDILTTRATQLLANPLSSGVGRVVEQTFGVDTFQLTPSLIDPGTLSTSIRVNPSARVTIGKRISDRAYLTYSRSLSSALNDQILLLEYDQSDRMSWILSRNEDQTYAVEVRVRHAF